MKLFIVEDRFDQPKPSYLRRFLMDFDLDRVIPFLAIRAILALACLERVFSAKLTLPLSSAAAFLPPCGK